MTTQKQLKQETEKFTGQNTVIKSFTNGFLMVEMENSYLANEVYKVWVKLNNTIVEIKENKVYAFAK